LISGWQSIASNNLGLFVAVSSTYGNTAATSIDGINWILRTMPVAASWTCVAYAPNGNGMFSEIGGGLFVANSSGSVSAASSPDGITWASRTQTNLSFTSSCYAPIRWRSNDTLTINNSAIVTANTNQNKFWSAITINDGRLSVKNTSTTSAIRFVTGRSSGAAAQAITPASGLAYLEFEGNWIQIGVGNGSASQTMTVPYTDYVPALWVETAVGSGVYEIWLNVTGVYGPSLPKFVEGIASVGTGARGKFFVQNPNPIQDTVLSLTNSSTTNASRVVKVSSTAGIYVGATITGTNITANSVVEKIVDSKTLEMNLMATGTAVITTVTIYNPYSAQLLNTVTFGDGVNGNTLTNGVKVRIPNIMATSDTSTKLQTVSSVLGMSIVMTSAGNLSMKTCLFDEAWHNLNQSQSCVVENVGMALSPTFSEIYTLTINGLGVALSPVRRYYATGWFQRDTRDLAYGGGRLPISYVNNAVLNNIVLVMNETFTGTNNAASGGTIASPQGSLVLSYSTLVTVTNCRFYRLQQYQQGRWGLSLTAGVTYSTFTNIEIYGQQPISMAKSFNNTFTNITFAASMFEQIQGYVAGGRYLYDPATGLDFVAGQKYYFKERSYYTRDRTVYAESQEFSATPFLGSTYFPDYLTCYCNAHTSVLLAWTNRTPVHNFPAYEIYRSRVTGFTPDVTNRIYSTNTATIVTWTNAGAKPTRTAGAVTLTFSSAKTITASGAGGFVTDGFIIGDILQVTGTLLNNGWYTISNVTATVITVNEGLITEAAYSATAVLTATHVTNHNKITATASRTMTFNVNKTITMAGATPGSLTLIDGYVVGDVIEVTGCTNPINNGTKTINTLTATVITVNEPLATESTYTATATFAGKPLLNNTTYYYIFRKYDTYETYHDSAEQEVYVHNPAIITCNRLLQNEIFENASWVASTGMTVTAAVDFSPTAPMSNGNLSTTPPCQTADKLAATAPNANISQAFSTAIGNYYTFSVWVAINALETMTSSAGFITLGAATTSFVATQTWQRVSVTYQAVAVSTTARISVSTSGQNIIVSGAMANDGAIALPPIVTTTAVVTNTNDSRYPILMRPWCRSLGGETAPSGIEIQFHATTPTGQLLCELYCSPTKGFTPSISNRLCAISVASSQAVVGLDSNCTYNMFDTITQIGRSFDSGNRAVVNAATYCSNNIFKNFTVDMCYAYIDYALAPQSDSNNNMFHKFRMDHFRNYTTTSLPIINSNSSFGSIFQSIIMSPTCDFPINNQCLDSIIKGMSGAYATPPNAATIYLGNMVYPLGSTTDGMSISYTAVYDYNFSELYFSTTTGALYLTFNDSSKTTKPFTLINNAKFSNTGRLYLRNVGDGIEIAWPHKILGVSGFANITPKYYGVDLGTSVAVALDVLEGLYAEFSIKYDINDDWPDYIELTAEHLSSTPVSASAGFYFKVRLTAKTGMKYSTLVNPFVIDEVIEGAQSLAYATVDKDFYLGNTLKTGTLWLSNINGTFIPGELIRAKSSSASRATNVATNTSFALYPSFSSYVAGLQIYTTIDQTVMYPSSYASITLQNVAQGSHYYVFKTATQEYVASGTQTGILTDIVIPNIGYSVDEYLTIRVRLSSPSYTKYLPFETQALFTSSGVTSYISQELDTIST